MARTLLVDDDPDLANVLAIALSEDGHDVVVSRDGRDADTRMGNTGADFAICICDVNLPGVDGFTLVKRWRARGVALPILLLTSRDSEIDEALGLELGADDYVTKPVRVRALSARVSALLRRAVSRVETHNQVNAVIVRGHLSIDTERLEVRYKDEGIVTTLSELRLLEALVQRPGVVLSRSRILEHVRGEDAGVDDRIIDTYVRRLRRKLEAIDPGFDWIQTVTGVGYRWRDP